MRTWNDITLGSDIYTIITHIDGRIEYTTRECIEIEPNNGYTIYTLSEYNAFDSEICNYFGIFSKDNYDHCVNKSNKDFLIEIYADKDALLKTINKRLALYNAQILETTHKMNMCKYIIDKMR